MAIAIVAIGLKHLSQTNLKDQLCFGFMAMVSIIEVEKEFLAEN